MSAGNVTDGIDQNHDGETPNNGDSGEGDDLVVVQIHDHRRTSGEYQKVSSEHLRRQLGNQKDTKFIYFYLSEKFSSQKNVRRRKSEPFAIKEQRRRFRRRLVFLKPEEARKWGSHLSRSR